MIGALRVCADCAKDSPDNWTYLNKAARPLLRSAADEIERLRAEPAAIASEARRYAAMYPQSSDGRNTFILLAEWIEARGRTEQSPPHNPSGAA